MVSTMHCSLKALEKVPCYVNSGQQNVHAKERRG